MKIRCAIFDFDGTLFDSMFIWNTAGEVYLRSIGKEPEADVQKVLKPMSLLQSAQYLREKYHIPLSVQQIMDGINRTVEDFYFHAVEPKPGVVDFLERMAKAGISMCIATATERYQVEAAVRRCKLRHFFCEIFTCGEVGSGKDEPVIFRTAMERLGADRSTTVVFEDALHAVQTAKADGFSVVAVYDSSEKRQDAIRALADCFIADFEHPEEFWKFASAE